MGSRLNRLVSKRRLTLERLERRDIPAFVTPPVYPAGTNPTAMVTHDFNGDGLQDIAVTNQTTLGRVSLLLNTGGGAFGAPSIFPTGGAEPSSIAVGDINGDGRTDVVVTNSGSGTVAVMRGTGTGAFRRPINFSAGPLPWDVAVGDLNGDGALDVVVANRVAAGTVSVLLNNGLGALGSATPYATGDSARDVILTDFDGDSNLDVGVANSGDGTVGVLPGRGDGVLRPIISYGVGASPYGVAAGDFNADGKPDLVAAHNIAPGVVSVLLGNGDGTFEFKDYEAVADNAIAVQVADVTGDGSPDVVTSHQSWATLSILIEPVGGNFTPSQHLLTQDDAAGLMLADLDNAGKLDFATTTASGSGVAVMLASDPTYSSIVAHTLVDSPRDVAIADVNNDGNLDLVSVNVVYASKSSISALLGNGDGSFLPPRYSPSGGYNGGPTSIAVGEFNNDGFADEVFTFFNGDASVLLGNGDGTFQSPVTYSTGNAYSLIVADFDEDGNQDFAVGAATSVFLGNGDGTFGPRVNYGQGDTLALGDFNGDGKLDIVSDGSGANLFLRLGNGDGTFQAPSSFPLAAHPTAVVVDDFNSDGNLDVATLNNSLAPAGGSVLLGNGDGTFQPFTTYTIGGSPDDLISADFDGDGNPDLASADDDPVSSFVSVLLGSGDGTFGAPQLFTTGPDAWQQIALAANDLNSDGLPDIAVTADGPVLGPPFDPFNTISVLINDGNWAPAPIGGGPETDLTANIANQQQVIAITPVSNETKPDELRHSETAQPAATKQLSKPTNRIIHALTARSDELANDVADWIA